MVGRSTNSAVEIANLVYRYAEYIDSGDLEGAWALLTHAKIKTAVGEIGPAEVLEIWRKSIIVYEDGTPRTKHATGYRGAKARAEALAGNGLQADLIELDVRSEPQGAAAGRYSAT